MKPKHAGLLIKSGKPVEIVIRSTGETLTMTLVRRDRTLVYTAAGEVFERINLEPVVIPNNVKPVACKPANVEALNAFEACRKLTEDRLKHIADLLERNAPNPDRVNWTHAGTMMYVSRELQNIIDSIEKVSV